MANFTMNIQLDNAAFYDYDDFDPAPELSLIFGRVRSLLEQGRVKGCCIDSNGNPVGTWEIKE